MAIVVAVIVIVVAVVVIVVVVVKTRLVNALHGRTTMTTFIKQAWPSNPLLSDQSLDSKNVIYVLRNEIAYWKYKGYGTYLRSMHDSLARTLDMQKQLLRVTHGDRQLQVRLQRLWRLVK